MDKKAFIPVRQKMVCTDGIACMLAAYRYFGKIERATDEQAVLLCSRFGAVSVPGVLPSGLCAGLAQYPDLEVTLCMESGTLCNPSGTIDPNTFRNILLEEERGHILHQDMYSVRRHYFEFVRPLKSFVEASLDCGQLLIFLTRDMRELSESGSGLRWIVLYNKYITQGETRYCISDPGGGDRALQWDEMEKLFHKGLGLTIISVGVKKAGEKQEAAEKKDPRLKTAHIRIQATDSLNRDRIFQTEGIEEPDYELLCRFRDSSLYGRRGRYLVSQLKNVNALLLMPEKGGVTTYLAEAVRYSSLHTVHDLLRAGAEPDLYDERFYGKFTALWELVGSFDPNQAAMRQVMVQLLLSYGANGYLYVPGTDMTIYEAARTLKIKSPAGSPKDYYYSKICRLFDRYKDKWPLSAGQIETEFSERLSGFIRDYTGQPGT